MRSLNTSSRNRGFTLIEIIVVMAIVTAVIGFGLFMSLDSYRGINFRSEREVVMSLLTKARSRAMNNIYQTSWGVCYSAPNYVLYRGSTCAPAAVTSELVAASPAVTITGLSGVVFSQLAGTTTGATIVVTQNNRTSTTTINNEGTISW